VRTGSRFGGGGGGGGGKVDVVVTGSRCLFLLSVCHVFGKTVGVRGGGSMQKKKKGGKGSMILARCG